jgi:NTP pyrophosphatase (non-canonical NTP hydrolase)
MDMESGKETLIEVAPSPKGMWQVDEQAGTCVHIARKKDAANPADLREKHFWYCPAMQKKSAELKAKYAEHGYVEAEHPEPSAVEPEGYIPVPLQAGHQLPLRPAQPGLVTPLRSMLNQAVGKNLAGESLVDKPSIAMRAYNEKQERLQELAQPEQPGYPERGGPVTMPLPPYYSLSLVDKITFNSPVSEVQGYVSRWAEATFKHNEVGIALHLLSEAVEVAQAAGATADQVKLTVTNTWQGNNRDTTSIPEETADVVILALTLAGYLDFDLAIEIIHKMSKNKLRKWGKPNEQGFTEHVRETDGREEEK